MQNRSVNSNPNVQVLDVERLPENARAIIRGVLERISPIERQLLLALLAVRMHEDLGSIGHPIMMLSAHSVSKMTLWEAMQGLTDEMAKQGEAPFRTHILNVKSAVYSIMELLGAPVVEGDGVIFSFTADLDEKIRYCKDHDVPLILVFDKATKSPHILRTMLSLVKDGRFGGWQLGVPFRIVLLGDPTDWDKISEMGTALQSFADRFLYYVTTPQEELENQETTFERAHLPREMEQPQLLGAAGELEQMRAKLQSGKSARETAREHRDLMALLVLMSSPCRTYAVAHSFSAGVGSRCLRIAVLNCVSPSPGCVQTYACWLRKQITDSLAHSSMQCLLATSNRCGVDSSPTRATARTMQRWIRT